MWIVLLGHDVTKPVFGVTDKASLKTVSLATERIAGNLKLHF